MLTTLRREPIDSAATRRDRLCFDSTDAEGLVSIVESSRLWSVWGDRLLATLSLLLAVAAVLAWIQVFYLDQPLNEILAFNANDLGLLGPDGPDRALLGQHAFSDFQAFQLWGAQAFAGDFPDTPPPYLPISYAYGALYSGFAPWAAVLLHQGLTIVVTWLGALLLLRGLPLARRIVIVFLTTVATLPMVATLDTGNIQGLTVALLICSVAALQRGHVTIAWLILGLAISFKGYPALLLIWPLAVGAWRFALKAALVALIVNGVLFVIFPGGLIENFSRYITALFGRPGMGMIDAESSLRSFAAKTVGLISNQDAPSIASNSGLILTLSLLWTLIVFLLLRTRRLPQWAQALLALSLLQMAVPTTYNYGLGWASLAALWFGIGNVISEITISSQDTSSVTVSESYLRWMAIAALAATLSPLGFRLAIGDVVVNVSTMLSPLLLTAYLLVCLILVVVRQSPRVETRGSLSSSN